VIILIFKLKNITIIRFSNFKIFLKKPNKNYNTICKSQKIIFLILTALSSQKAFYTHKPQRSASLYQLPTIIYFRYLDFIKRP
jgi:hypothetical protein